MCGDVIQKSLQKLIRKIGMHIAVVVDNVMFGVFDTNYFFTKIFLSFFVAPIKLVNKFCDN